MSPGLKEINISVAENASMSTGAVAGNASMSSRATFRIPGKRNDCREPFPRDWRNPLSTTSSVTPRTSDQISKRGYAVLRGVVPRESVEDALRHLHLDLVRRGAPAEELGS